MQQFKIGEQLTAGGTVGGVGMTAQQFHWGKPTVHCRLQPALKIPALIQQLIH